MKRKSLSSIAASVLLASALVAACGDDDESSAASDAPQATESSAGGRSDSAADCVAKAKANAAAGMEPMKLKELSPIDASSLAGKKFATIQLIAAAPLSNVQAIAVGEALKEVGAEHIDFDGKGTPDVIAQAFQSAIAQDVAGIVTIGMEPALAKNSIAEAKKAGIPVVVATAIDPTAPMDDGVVAIVAPDSVLSGRLIADHALVATNCELDAAVFFTTAGTVTVSHANGAEAEIKELCGDSCSIEKVEFNASNFPTSLPGLVQTTLQRSPDLNFLISTADALNPYILQGREAVGSDVPLAGAQGDTLADAIAGKAQVVDVQWPPGEVNGWFMADAILRAALGKPETHELPQRLVDASNWGTSTEFAAQFPGLVGYQDMFREAWGV